ncbi:MAG: substrate-binding domain-containing protein [Saprospiraceae bacterium]|nr:substrate-binding domain-containing protein [Saprospiraceae bacterium]
MHWQKLIVTLLIPGIAGLLLAGCRGSDRAGTKLVIFSQANNAEPYRAAQNERMRTLFGRHEDIRLEIYDAQQDNQQQIFQIETAIKLNPDLLIVAPNEAQPLTRVMGKAMEAGIPTICLERNITEPHYTTYIRIDNFAIGQKAGEFIVDTLTAKYGEPSGKIVELRGLLGVAAEENRYNGAHSVFDRYPDVQVVQDAVADWLQSNARERMTEILRTQPVIDVVYGHNDPMAMGAYLAARDLGREEEMVFVGIDGLGGPAGGIRKVMDGILDVTFRYPLGVDKAVDVGLKILRDSSFVPEKTYTIESAIVTPQNAEKMYETYTFRESAADSVK